MKIKKVFQGAIPENKIVGTKTTSNTDAYTCNYINEKFDDKSAITLMMSNRNTYNLSSWVNQTLTLNTVKCKVGNNLRAYGYGIKAYKRMFVCISAMCCTWQSSVDSSEFDFYIELKRNGSYTNMAKAYGGICTVNKDVTRYLDHRNISNFVFELLEGDEVYIGINSGNPGSVVVLGDNTSTYLSIIEL